jgi:hypothetical protein
VDVGRGEKFSSTRSDPLFPSGGLTRNIKRVLLME